MNDIQDLQWIAARSFDCMFMPDVMDLTQHPRIYPLIKLDKSIGLFSLLIVSPRDV